ncbi:hypothetical protein TRIATDRAFT_189576 [Trichoderma atroviride IMI 206040]|uniref:DUF7779 domain-containing protein n=1 Tax=Hypocrea atroviridis (strain ATCC 20476 / IMI 206040) TaxID=452589 RepID=G9NIB6_HYPAI|nr:uncharacterized protein TRIATDRAFT_189576 [Trichoderma atroviride IMI 206040]EHK49529.1 hypothetical protein TRIATDRAFT_189576 [Trichoderma atroviride IMI 206040]
MQLTGKYKSISNSLSQTVHFIKESSEAKIIQEEKKREEIFGRLTHLPIEAESDESSIAKLSIQESDTPQGYYYVPFRHNQNFFGREELLLEIEQKLESRDDALRSLSIWGTGGVGKTQIALEFAYRQHRKGVKYILWIPSEHHSESAKAFTQVAGLLKLSGATTSKGHEQNKLLVLHFLQHTSKCLKLLEGSLPSCGSGSILITCRSEILASSVADEQIEIPVLTDREGSTLMLKQLGIANPSAKERELTEEFSSELGGLSLAIDLMSRHMRTRKKGVAQFLPYYREKRALLHRNPQRGITNIYYNGDLESSWTIAFGQLDEQSIKVFRVLCMLAPDRIPLTVLSHEAVTSSNPEHKEGEKLDEEDLENIIVNLVDLALVRTNDTSTMLSVHRLTQLAFREHQKSCQVETFIRVCKILRDLFPRQDKGFALFNHWIDCEKLAEHVQMLCERYQSMCQASQSLYLEDFSYLLSDCGR